MLSLGIVLLSQIAQGREVICLRTSRGMGYRVRSGEAVGKPVGILDGVQWMRAPEWFLDPLSAIALAQGLIYWH